MTNRRDVEPPAHVRLALAAAWPGELIRFLAREPLGLGRHDLVLFDVLWNGRPRRLLLRTFRHRLTWWADDDADKASREAAALRRARAAGVPAPEIVAAGSDWTLVTWTDGHPLGDETGSGSDPRGAATALARVLARLQGASLPTGPFPQPTPRSVVVTLRRWSDRLANNRLHRAIKRIQAPPASAAVFLHGDPNRTNVLINADGRIAGLIDWEDAAIGDRRFDVCRAAVSLDRLDPDLARTFMRAYEEGWGERLTDLAHWHALLAVQRWAVSELLYPARRAAGPSLASSPEAEAEQRLTEAGW